MPVLSNGNVNEWRDLLINKQLTACDGLMVGEALLTDPTLFSGPTSNAQRNDQRTSKRKRSGEVPCSSVVLGRVREYLELAGVHPPSQGFSVVQQHVHHMLGKQGRGTTLRYRFAPSWNPSCDETSLSTKAKALRDEIVNASTCNELLMVAERALSGHQHY
jgi:tRNA-dihydrouridine synthase